MTDKAVKIYTENMNSNQLKNVGRLLVKASDLGIEINEHCEIGYNATFGNVWLWSEWHIFTLFISDFDSRIKALFTDVYDGTETERLAGNDLDKLESWASKLDAKTRKKHGDD